MQVITKAQTVWEDPLSFKTLKEGDRVTLESLNGIITDFIVDEIQSETIILAPLASKKKKAFSSTLVVSMVTVLGKIEFKKGDIVYIKHKSNPPQKFIVDYNLNNQTLVLRDPKRPGSILNSLLRILNYRPLIS